MPKAIQEQKRKVDALLQRHGGSYAQSAGINLKNTPAPLFQLLIMSLLLSARISADKAVTATRSLFSAGFTTPQKMVSATWQQRVDAITWSGYKRYDERTATMLGDTAQRVLETYGGDLRELCQQGVHPFDSLQEFSGIGAVGANIFLREVQLLWNLYPFADDRVLHIATALGLPGQAQPLAQLCQKPDFPRLTAALMRVKQKRSQEAFLRSLTDAQ